MYFVLPGRSCIVLRIPPLSSSRPFDSGKEIKIFIDKNYPILKNNVNSHTSERNMQNISVLEVDYSVTTGYARDDWNSWTSRWQ